MLKTAFRFAATGIALLAAVVIASRLWNHYMYSPWTRDARIRADVVAVAPDVGGLVTAVSAADNQSVRRGDLLFQIDAARYRLAVARAAAELAAAHTEFALKQAEALRRVQMRSGAISEEDRESARAAAQGAAARVQAAEAALAEAQLNLQRTGVRAPVDGYVTNLNVHTGDYAVAGHAMLALVDRHSFRAEGYFEETKIPSLHVGDRVDIRLMSSGAHLRGSIASIARAIAAPDTAGLLSNVNPTDHWVRLAQRIPVRIAIDALPAQVALAAGMTCTVTVQPRDPQSSHG